MPKSTKTDRPARDKERIGPFEPDPMINRIIPTGSSSSCYFLSPIDGTTKLYEINSGEFYTLIASLDKTWHKKVLEQMEWLAKTFPDSDWSVALETVEEGT